MIALLTLVPLLRVKEDKALVKATAPASTFPARLAGPALRSLQQ
ncbi:hypothetical protein [Rickettsia australis]|nr:hypothetical protein [Rickettsia australis]